LNSALFKKSTEEYITTSTVQWGGIVEHLYLIKLNSFFDTLFTKKYIIDSSTVTSPIFTCSFEDSSGNYIILGEDSKDSLGITFPNNYQNGLMIKTDTSGTVINYKLYSGQSDNHDWFNCGLQMGNYYYLFGATRSYAPSHIVGFDRNDGWVVKTDLQGNEIASAAFGHPELNDGEFKFAFSLPNFKHATGFTKGRFYIINDDLSINRELIIGRNELVNDTNYALTFWDGYVENNVITLLGRETRFNMSTYQYTSIVKVVKLDLNYKIINHKYYTHANYLVSNLIPQTITPTSDGGYIFGGYVVDNTLTPTQQAWLVKTDSLGCDGFTSCNDTAIVVQILNHPDTLCKDSAYQIAVRLKGRSAPYSLYAYSTLALDSIYYPYTLPLWIDTIMPVTLPDTGWQSLVVTLHEPWERTASDTVQVYVRNCTTSSATQKFYEQKVEIYPNPATHELHVKFRGVIEGTYTITIYDTHGKTVDIITTKAQERVIDISGFTPGIYHVLILGDGIFKSQNLVIQKQ